MSKARDERVKLVAGTANTVGLAFLGFAFVRPVVEGDPLGLDVATFVGLAFAAHGLAHHLSGKLDGGADDRG